MNVEAKEIVKESEFKPFVLNLSVNTLEEASALWNIFNHAAIVMNSGITNTDCESIRDTIHKMAPKAVRNRSWDIFASSMVTWFK